MRWRFQLRSKAMRPVCLAALVLAACGNGDATAEFAGTWMYASGAALVGTCTSNNPTAVPLSGTVVLATGGDADLTSMMGTCTELYDVDGSRATARSGQSCTIVEGIGGDTTVLLTFDSDVITIGSDPDVLTESAIAGVQLMGGLEDTCTVMGTWMLDKLRLP